MVRLFARHLHAISHAGRTITAAVDGAFEVPDEHAAELAAAFGMSQADIRQQLLSWHAHDWQADPYARGAYSYAPAGAIDASARMTQPVEQTLYFAGEHTDVSGHWGTVHGALRSGIRAAAQLLQPHRQLQPA